VQESGSALRVLVTPIFEQLEGLLAINPVSDVIMKSVIQVLKVDFQLGHLHWRMWKR
jgi:hypothetical protein